MPMNYLAKTYSSGFLVLKSVYQWGHCYNFLYGWGMCSENSSENFDITTVGTKMVRIIQTPSLFPTTLEAILNLGLHSMVVSCYNFCITLTQ